MALQDHPEEYFEPEIDPEEIINVLWDNPGMSWKELHAHFKINTIGEHRAFSRAADTLMGLNNRIRVVRFTTYAPYLRTTFRIFPMEKGRIEVVNDDGISYLFVDDPFGKWDEKMEEALR